MFAYLWTCWLASGRVDVAKTRLLAYRRVSRPANKCAGWCVVVNKKESEKKTYVRWSVDAETTDRRKIKLVTIYIL